MERIFQGLAVLALMLAIAAPARAEWFEARTGHFLIYVEDSEANARDFATRLERFDLALRRLYDVPDNPERHAVPARIFALKDPLYSRTCGCWNVLGYYSRRVGGSVIFSLHDPAADRQAKPGSWSSQTVLLHEYGHHFMYSNYPLAYPYWFSEGFAEFNANVIYNDDGSVTIGVPANYRAEALKSGGSLNYRAFFEPQSYGFGSRRDLIYARGWLLTHYLVLHPARRGQLAAYLAEMNRGVTSLEAATTAFGDPKKLYDEMIAYGRVPLAAPLRIPPPAQPIAVELRRLSKGEIDMLPVHAVSVSGVNRQASLRHAVRARDVAAGHPDDPVVQLQLAEAEFIAERYDRADAAADRALALRPGYVEAMICKGRAAAARAVEAKATDAAAWAAARSWYLKANRAEPNAALPLFLYYQSFEQARAKPSPGAVKGLSRAHVLSPESSSIRVALARQMLEDGDSASARFLLQPIAFTPHRRRDDNVAARVIALIDGGKAIEAKAALDGDKEDADKD